MKGPDQERLPEELEAVAARLQAARAHGDPLQLDEIKQRVIARCTAQPGGSKFMKRWLTTLATVFALVGGTGGAIAVAGDNHGNDHGAAYGEYCEGHQKVKHEGPPHGKGDDCGQGDENHGHEGGGKDHDGKGDKGHADVKPAPAKTAPAPAKGPTKGK